MDNLSINKIHQILLDATLPSTIEDLKNPTEDYIIKLITKFLLQFSIDMNVISQPIPEQYDIMPYFNDSDTINLINLHAGVAQIFNKIFLSDFCIIDITSPGQKRLRRQSKFLANFILYTNQKKLEFTTRIDEIQDKIKSFEEWKYKKCQVLECINNKALHKAKQLSLIKKLENDIQHARLRLEKINKKELELEVKKNNAEKDNQNSKELYGSVKTAAGKLSKTIAKLQSEIVHSPEEYKSRLDKLKEQENLKIEERDIMQEAIQDKKQSIKQIRMKLSFVQKINDEFATLKHKYEQLKSQKVQLDNIKKQNDSVNNTWNDLQNKLTMHKDQVNTEINELQSYREENIAPLYDLYNQLLSEKKLQKAKLETSKAFFNEKCLERSKLQEDIKKKEEEVTAFVNSCQEMYDNEIADELELRKVLEESGNKRGENRE